LIEQAMGQTTERILLPKQPGDVEASAADVGPMRRDFGWKPTTPVEVGVPAFIEWWRQWVGRD
jgi:UDP-glucuronate 4-epimerase